MGYGGARPKEDRSQIRHRNPVHEFDEIPDVAWDGPALPARYRFDKAGQERVAEWPSATKRWWESVRTMPHCKRWTASDWEFAFTTAEQHAKTQERGVGYTELRQREFKMGTTLDARNAMRIRYVALSVATVREETGEVKPEANVIAVDFGDMYGGA